MVEVRKSTRIKSEPGLKRRFSDALEAEATTPAKPAKSAKTTANSTPRTAAKQPTPQQPAALILPNKLTDTTPFPIVANPQTDDLPDSEWQDLSSSSVFAASLTRSRRAIIHGAFFTKFWTKPVPTKKQKDMTEEEKAAFKEAKGPTQSKVGLVKMVSEPFTFEVQVFMVKDLTHAQRNGQLPLDRMHLVYGQQPTRTASPAYAGQGGYRPMVQQQMQQAPVMRQPAPITPHPSTPLQHVAPARPAASISQVPAPAAAPVSRTSTPTQTAPKPPTSTSQVKPAANPQAPDPVIHALAQRASANPELKAVMKIVATGRATPQQLQYFQKHIDELTEMVRQKQEQDAKTKETPGAASPVVKAEVSNPAVKKETSNTALTAGSSTATPSSQATIRPPSTPAQTAVAAPPRTSTPTQPPAPSAPSQSSQAPQPPTQITLPPAATPQPAFVPRPLVQQHTNLPRQAGPISTPQQQPPQPQYQTPHQTNPQIFQHASTSQQPYHHNHHVSTPSTSYSAPPRPKMVTTATPLHILLQFGENASERFLFPKNCILEWNATLTEVVCSFVVSKFAPIEEDGDSAVDVSGKEVAGKKMKEVWAPVTVVFRGDAPTLSVLGRVAEPVEVARRNMEDAMVRGERGKDGFLALRLPIEPMEMKDT